MDWRTGPIRRLTTGPSDRVEAWRQTVLTMRTSQGALWATSLATEPSTRLIPCMRRLPTMMSSASRRSASAIRAAAGLSSIADRRRLDALAAERRRLGLGDLLGGGQVRHHERVRADADGLALARHVGAHDVDRRLGLAGQVTGAVRGASRGLRPVGADHVDLHVPSAPDRPDCTWSARVSAVPGAGRRSRRRCRGRTRCAGRGPPARAAPRRARRRCGSSTSRSSRC